MSKKVARLYDQFQPENYELSLKLDREAMTFSGTVTIRGKKTGRPSQRITFHQKELRITTAKVVKHDKNGDQEIKLSRVNNQNSLDEVRLHGDSMIYPGNYTVIMDFEGQITKPMNGIYPCFFKHNGQLKKLLATQFESHHAREAFPCIDEPEAKATFDLTLEAPGKETVLSNTPVKNQKAVGKNTVTSFETTPKMSVYLLAFVCGELKYKESKTKAGVLVRTYATPDNIGLADHGLDVAVRALEFFCDYFQVPYPLEKLDMVALPDFSSGAMENWGLVTYRETAMLVDPKSGSIESKQMVALVIAHELSHQWFGNLVTMKWWDDLWLNESFANLMEYVAVDALFPDWHIWESFVSNETGSAKRRDSLADVQPIKCEVRHPDEISTLFDPSIVYAKGGSILHMLLHYIGEDDFRKGLKAYFEQHQYGNTEADDLWAALSKASRQDISTFMDGWLKRPGYPLVSVDWQPGGQAIKLTQQRFLSDPAGSTAAKPWQVPLATSQPIDNSLLVKNSSQKTLVLDTDEPLIFNHNGLSYYLPRYQNAHHLQQITDGIGDGRVGTTDRLLILDNYTMLQRGGQASTVELLELLKSYRGEASESVWGAMAVAIGEIRKLIEQDEASEAKLNQIVRELAAKTVDDLGWDDKPSDDARTLRLRGLVHAIAAGAKSEKVIDQGLKRFTKFNKPADLPASTRSTVYFIASRHGSAADFKKLFGLYESAQNAEEKEEIANGLSATKDPKRIKNLLGMLKTDAVRRQDLLNWLVWLLRNRYSRTAAWQWLVDEWGWIEKEFASDKSYGYFARYPGSIFSRPEELQKFKKFFGNKRDVVSMSRDIALAEAEISSRIAWRQRNEAAVKAWLKKQS